jgi:hypothetical protein
MLCPTPQTEVLKRIMKMKPKKKKLRPLPGGSAVVVAAKRVTPNAKKKNQRGVAMKSPRSHAG